MKDLTVVAYFIYLPVVLLLTLYVARILFRNARVFMLDILGGKQELADSTNRLFEVGFYLLNMGFALWIMRIYSGVDDNQELVEVLAGKVGGFSIYLGVVLFLHLFLFFRGRRKAREHRQAPLPQPVVINA